MSKDENEYGILLYYKYTTIPDLNSLFKFYDSNCRSLGLLGPVCLASHGVNVTVCGELSALERHIEAVKAMSLFEETDFKLVCSHQPLNDKVAHECGFTSLSIRIVKAAIEANIILPLVHLLQHSEFEIKKEAARAISDATSGGSHEQIQFLVSQGCIKPLCDLLLCPDPMIVTVCLEGLENILKVGEADKDMGMNGGMNLYAQMIDECDGLDKIEKLQTHINSQIYEKAVNILERYWAVEEMEEQNVQDGVVGNQQQTLGSNEIYEKTLKLLERYWAEEEEREQHLQDGDEDSGEMLG